ncbi:Hemolysin-type calcium-binding region, partial [Synechococcus sp. WH 8016]
DGNDSISTVNAFLTGGSIEGNDGEDSLSLGLLDSVAVNGNADNDAIDLRGNIVSSSIEGGQGDDIISSFIDDSIAIIDSVISGDKGDDVIGLEAGLFNSSVIGGDGNDIISTENAFVTGGSIEGNNGEDSLSLGLLDSVAVNGNADNDVIDLRGNIESSSIRGGQGNDTISSFIDDSITITDSVIAGDKGDDVFGLEADLFNSSVIGGDGNDSISTVNAFLTGGSIEGNDGEDTLSLGLLDGVAVNGNADNDVIDFRSDIESSSIRGGQGNDTISPAFFINITDSVIAGDKGDDAIILGELNIETPLYNSTFNNASSADVDTVIDGGAGNDVIAFDGTQVEDATILGGEGADTFQLWNGGTVELTDFEAEIDTLILGNYFITTGTGTPTSALTGINWLIGASTSEGVVSSVTARIGSTTTANLGQPGSPLVSGNDWITARQDIFRLVSVNGNASGTVSGKVLFLDNQGPDAGLYVYSISKIDYLAGDKEAIFTENATTNSQTIALGNFNASDIVVI